MAACMIVSVEGNGIERVECDLAAVSFVEGDRPLAGEAGRADWRLLGLLSKLIVRGELRGAPGEVVLVPTAGRLSSPRLLAFGLGQLEAVSPNSLGLVLHQVLARAVALNLHSLALALPVVEQEDEQQNKAFLFEVSRELLRRLVGAEPQLLEEFALKLLCPAQWKDELLRLLASEIERIGAQEAFRILLGPTKSATAASRPVERRGVQGFREFST